MRLNSSIVKKLAEDIGIDGCGISNTKVENNYYDYFDKWLLFKYNANMGYLENYKDIRKDPELLLPNAKSIISIILNYYSDETLEDSTISIGKYAYGFDYHQVLKNKLKKLFKELKVICPNINGRIFVDTAPIFERYFAVKSGLGFIGKNNCLINKIYGSWVFIGEIIVDVDLECDSSEFYDCGSCTKCIDACPTGALTDKCLDANKCISYHTIENKFEIPSIISDKISTQIFGCDICQNVCPYNSTPIVNKHTEFKILSQIKNIDSTCTERVTEKEFNEIFLGSPLKRAGIEKLLKNINIVKSKNSN